jgi:hypothetical protein
MGPLESLERVLSLGHTSTFVVHVQRLCLCPAIL